MRKLQNYIDGAWVDSTSTETITVLNPATEEPIALLPAGSQEDVDAAVESAQRAFETWGSLPLEERLVILTKAADVIEANVDEFARIEALEMGRPPSVGKTWIAGAAGSMRGAVELARTYPFVREDGSNTVIERRAVGVAALITPWNFPTNVIVPGLGPLLAAGNTVVLKPSEKSPLSAIKLLEILDLPPGVLNLVLGDGRAGAPLSAHPGVGITVFTGSVRAGKAIAAASASHLRRAVLELGGKDPVIVDEDVDIAATARDVARGSFVNTGQICTSMERIYVHRKIADEFVEALLAEAKAYDYGDPNTTEALMGPLVDDLQRQTVIAHVEDARKRGAKIVLGGEVPEGKGYYYPATVLTDVTDDMLIMREETFGPVAPVQIVDSFEEALAKSKSTEFGLGATVYTNNPDHVKAARDIPAGIIWINKWQGGGSDLVFEPAGQSGMAVTGHYASFDSATRPSAILHNSVG
jgi:acyl-CoA reductase-like NAD-dependent aldehyde dehydrogenase